MSVNAQRGEVALCIGGRRRVLRLTMGALAELETVFGCDGMAALGARLRDMSEDDVRTMAAALLRGGGGDGDISDVRDWAVAARACAECFRLALRG